MEGWYFLRSSIYSLDEVFDYVLREIWIFSSTPDNKREKKL